MGQKGKERVTMMEMMKAQTMTRSMAVATVVVDLIRTNVPAMSDCLLVKVITMIIWMNLVAAESTMCSLKVVATAMATALGLVTATVVATVVSAAMVLLVAAISTMSTASLEST
jgi:hypothetical protein